MSQLSPLLRDVLDPATGRKSLGFFCPGCRHAHVIGVDGGHEPGKNWTWNGDINRPTFQPSVRVFTPAHSYDASDGTRKQIPESTQCHSFVTDGRIQFLDDSAAHQLRGWHDLAPWPQTYGGMES